LQSKSWYYRGFLVYLKFINFFKLIFLRFASAISEFPIFASFSNNNLINFIDRFAFDARSKAEFPFIFFIFTLAFFLINILKFLNDHIKLQILKAYIHYYQQD